DPLVTGVQTCALPISSPSTATPGEPRSHWPDQQKENAVETTTQERAPREFEQATTHADDQTIGAGVGGARSPGAVCVAPIASRKIGRASCREGWVIEV